MKRLVLLALLASTASAQQMTGAVVWLPPENFHLWSGLDALMRDRDDVKLTIGLTPTMATPLAKAALIPWVDRGRLELAARINGDPVLTVVTQHPAAPRPQDALERAVEARERLEQRLGVAPTGFIPGAGALDATVAAALEASGASWLLTGPYTSSDAIWAAGGRAVIVPASATNLFDESASTVSVFLATASKMPRPVQGWRTVSDLARAKTEVPLELSKVTAWPAWDPEAARIPPADAGAKAAWDFYGAAALALDTYQNSGAADLKTLDAAIVLLRKAQAARLYRSQQADGPSPEMRAALLAIYKRLKIPAPDTLYDASSAATSTAASDEHPTGVRALSGASWLEFSAPRGAIALVPSSVAGTSATAIIDGGAAADPWRIRSVRAEWDEAAVNLILRVGNTSGAVPRPIYELYMDFNHVLGAGRVPLLEGRGAVVPARDAWELALSIVGDEARLYRARGSGEPEETSTFKVQWSESGEVTLTVPRSYMRGNPARWGWAVVALAEDPARPGRHPATALVGADGTILLGALAPADLQKAILSRSNPRIPAARLAP